MNHFLQQQKLTLPQHRQLFRDLLIEEQVPTKKDEEWKYNNLNFLSEYKTYSPSMDEHRFTFSNESIFIDVQDALSDGVQLEGSLPDGIKVQIADNISGADLPWKFNNYFSDVRDAMSAQALLIEVGPEFVSDQTLHIKYNSAASAGDLYQPQMIVLCQPFVTVKIHVETTLSKKRLTNSGFDLFLADGARAQVLVTEGGFGRGFMSSRSYLQADSFLDFVTLNGCPQWSRHNTSVELAGSGAEAHLQAAYLGTGKQFIDHHTIIDHQVPHTTSSQTYNGVLSGQSEAVFNGRVNILRDAQKSSSAQMNRNLLLNKKAKVNTKPELQVDADDVSATHGATTGQMQDSELFYLQSRGINEQEAKRMICEGFARDVGMKLSPSLKEAFLKHMSHALPKVIEGSYEL